MKDAITQAIDWLENRGLDSELAVKMGWGAITKHGGIWLKIPYPVDGAVKHCQYRKIDGDKEFRFDKGAKKELWNVDVLKDTTLLGEPLVICEGPLDGLAAIQCGYPRVVGVPGWSNQATGQETGLELFKLHEPLLTRGKTGKKAAPIIVAADNDETGLRMLRAISNFLTGADVRWAKWPENCNDLNDVVKNHGAGTARRALQVAGQVDPPGGLITGFTDLPPRPKRRIWKLDYPGFDRRIGFRTQELSLITGRPNAGKTTFGRWLLHRVATVNKLRVGIMDFESDTDEMLEQFFKISTGENLEFADEEKIKQVKRQLDRQYRIVHRVESDGEGQGMLWLKNIIHTLAGRDGCSLIYIDPWNELEHFREPGENSQDYTNLALTKLRQWAEKYDVHIMLVAHPRKMEGNKPVGGYDISGAASWFDKVALGLTVHKADDDSVKLINWKTKNRRQQKCAPGKMNIQYDENAMLYRPAT